MTFKFQNEMQRQFYNEIVNAVVEEMTTKLELSISNSEIKLRDLMYQYVKDLVSKEIRTTKQTSLSEYDKEMIYSRINTVVENPLRNLEKSFSELKNQNERLSVRVSKIESNHKDDSTEIGVSSRIMWIKLSTLLLNLKECNIHVANCCIFENSLNGLSQSSAIEFFKVLKGCGYLLKDKKFKKTRYSDISISGEKYFKYMLPSNSSVYALYFNSNLFDEFKEDFAPKYKKFLIERAFGGEDI